jgi:hypothetical protein
MPKGYALITYAVGAVVREKLGRVESEPMPKRITELLDALSQRDGPDSREPRKKPRAGNDRASSKLS